MFFDGVDPTAVRVLLLPLSSRYVGTEGAPLEDQADTYGWTDAQVWELAIVNLLDLDTTSLDDLGKLRPMSQLAEEHAILKARLRALGQAIED